MKKKKIGGDTGPGKGYRGFPHSPTTEVDSAVSARKRGGLANFANGGDTDKDGDDDQAQAAKKGGHVKKRQMGGPMVGQQQPGLLGMPMPGRSPTPPQQGAPNLSGRPALPAQPLTVPMPPTLASMRSRPAPGTTTGFKRGGSKHGDSKHSDEAEDKKLIKSMLAKEEKKETKAEKRKHGGAIAPSIEGGKSVLGALRADQRIGSVPRKSVPKGHATVLAGEKYKNWGSSSKIGGKSSKIGRKHGGTAGDSIQQAAPTHLAGENYKSWGTGYRARGGSVQAPYGSGSGLGRLRKEKSAAKVPAKTEI